MTEAAAEPTEDAADPTEEPRRRLQPAEIACGAGLALGVIAVYVFAGLTPSLLAHHSVLLESLNGSTAAVVTGGALARVGRASLLLVLAAPLVSILLYDIFYWWAGVLWGNRIAHLYARNSPRAQRWLDRAEDVVRRRGAIALPLAYFLPVPNVLIYIFCGTSGMPLWLFLIGDAIGTLLWAGTLTAIGWSAGQHAVDVVNTIQHYSIQVTIGIVIVFVLVGAVRRRRHTVTP